MSKKGEHKMHIYSSTLYGIADRTNYNDRRIDFKSLSEALENLLKTSDPTKYMIIKGEFSRVFDDHDVFQRESLQISKVDYSLFEIRKCTEMGDDYSCKFFSDIQEAFEYSNLCERYEPGWHFYHIEHKI